MATSQTRTQSRLIPYLLIFLGAIGGYIYYSQVTSFEAEVAPPPSSTVDALKSLRLDFKVLEDERYRALRAFGEFPVSPGVTGKADPFSAF